MTKQKRRKGHEWMRAQDAAKLLGKTRPTVLAMVARGEIGSIAVAGLVFVSRKDVTALAEQKAA
jgi:excisionase family DNA binding protein